MSTVWEDPLVTNHDTNGVFNGTIDPSAMGFNGSPINFDFGPMQGTPLPQHVQNGIQRNGSPAQFQQPPYQTSSVIPAKRPHTDSHHPSPRQPSRSITPQQAQFAAGFSATTNGQPMNNAFQNFSQVNSTTASPSPVMHNQPFNVNGSHQQRVQTASPSPFSPAITNAGIQMSPAPSDYSGHGEHTQNGMAGFPHGNTFTNGHGAASPSYQGQTNVMAQNAVPGSSNMDPIEQQRRLAAMRQAAFQRQQAGMVSAQQRPGVPQQGVPPQVAHLEQQRQKAIVQAQQHMMRPVPAEQFIAIVTSYNQSKAQTFNPSLTVGGRSIHPANLFGVVMRAGGSKTVSVRNLWPQVALQLALNPGQVPTAPSELLNYWQSNLYQYEQFIITQFTQRKLQINNQYQQMVNQVLAASRMPQSGMPTPQNSAMVHMRRSSGVESQGQPQMSPQVYPNQTTGFPQGHQPRPGTQGSMTITMPAQTQARTTPTRLPSKRTPSGAGSQPDSMLKENEPSGAPTRTYGPQHLELPDVFEALKFCYYRKQEEPPTMLEHHGPIAIADYPMTYNAEVLDSVRPERPLLESGELGTIDVHNLTMSIKSGIAGEVKVALDILSDLTLRPFCVDLRNTQFYCLTLPLEDCDDLLESLIECAEEQIRILADNADEISDDIVLSSYHDVVRSCQVENISIQEVPEVGTHEYDLKQAADKVVCIMSILQNLSCLEERMFISTREKQLLDTNVRLLTEASVVTFVANVIRYLGTRSMLLRTYRNTLDFYKDAILYLSNISADLELPGKDEALCILHFLLSFSPPVTTSASHDSNHTIFSPQDPTQHRYLRFAVDSLAKLLARDEPNRTYFRSILTADAPYDLLTQAFSLAISPVPEESKRRMEVLHHRQGYLSQGLLAADTLASIIPSDASSLAQSWLYSSDGWTSNLVRLITMLGIEHPPMAPNPSRPQSLELDIVVQMSVVERGLSTLLQLAEKSREAGNQNIANNKVSRLASQDLILKSLQLEPYLHVNGIMTQQTEQSRMRGFVRKMLKQLNVLMELEV